MTGALKMVKLDILTVKSQLSSYLIAVMFGLFGAYMDDPQMYLGINMAWFSVLMASNIFAVQENNKLERLYGSVSISQKDVVLGRYIFMWINHIICIFTAIIAYLVAILFRNEQPKIPDVLLAFGVSLAAFSAVAGVGVPVFFKMGYIKARYWFLFIFLITFVALLILYLRLGLLTMLFANQAASAAILTIASSIIQYVSYRFSIHAYRNRA